MIVEAQKQIRTMAGIVTFNPDMYRLQENISRIIEQVDEVVICDNGSDNMNEISQIVDRCHKLKLIVLDENYGIAYALNKILLWATEYGYEWFITLDQDSVVENQLISQYLRYINIPNLAMMTCTISDRNFEGVEKEEQGKFLFVDKCITSANFVNTRALNSVGGYDTKMFIDYVDFDLCASLREAGYVIIKVNFRGLLHELGHTEMRRILGKDIYLYNNSSLRKYYMARNGVYYVRKHKRYLGRKGVVRNIYIILKRIVLVFLFEKERCSNLRSEIKGLIEGIKMEVK